MNGKTASAVGWGGAHIYLNTYEVSGITLGGLVYPHDNPRRPSHLHFTEGEWRAETDTSLQLRKVGHCPHCVVWFSYLFHAHPGWLGQVLNKTRSLPLEVQARWEEKGLSPPLQGHRLTHSHVQNKTPAWLSSNSSDPCPLRTEATLKPVS